jgi:OOP family OmpA-OmpF porin
LVDKELLTDDSLPAELPGNQKEMIMRTPLNPPVLALLAGLSLAGCAKKDETAAATQVSESSAASASPTQTSPPLATGDAASAMVPGFDVSRAPVANPPQGQFPYVGLIEGYKPINSEFGKDARFDRYEFFDGTKIIPVEGRLATIVAQGTGASTFEIFKTYESLVTRLGGVKVYEGVDPKHQESTTPEYTDRRHRNGFSADRVGVYMVRTPASEIWVEAYYSDLASNRDKYFLTVVEKKGLETRASLLPAEEMKRELDSKGHVALYINFDFDKADIKPDSRPIINEVVKLLSTNPSLNLTVEGHTDNVGIPDYNKRLSDARAKSVVAALTAQGIQERRLRAAGFGQEKPIADNSTDAGRAQNRRVELVKAG